CQPTGCGGTGGRVGGRAASALPRSARAARVPACTPVCADVPLTPSFLPAATGTDCSADGDPTRSICGDTTTAAAGTCVECDTDADCTGGTCSDNVCTPHGSITFLYSGSEQDFTCRREVTSVTATADGASGGPVGNLGGLGGSVTATIPVSPGETLAIFVGGVGDPTFGQAGYNGGGTGGFGVRNSTVRYQGAGPVGSGAARAPRPLLS